MEDGEDMKLSDDTLCALKNMELDILREFDYICKKLNLRYYLLGGTLLGAVRHNGFIPWDDDIDVGMLRADYEVFLREGQKLLPDYLFVQTHETDPGYVHCFAKIRNSNTTFIETSAGNMRINHGVFIDVFPLDFYPDDPQERTRFIRRNKWYSRRTGVQFLVPENQTPKGKLRKAVIKALFPSLTYALKKREQLYRSVEKSSRIANHGGAWGEKEIVPADWYGEGTPVMFEGMELLAPAKYDQWLTQVYGNYMQPPPIEKRVGHHYVDVIDLNKPYTEYMRKIT